MAQLQKLFDLHGRVALVTGGSRGLGLQIAEALAEYGATTALVARKQDELDGAVAHLEGLGGTAFAVAADLRTPEACVAMVEQVIARAGHIDILINSAGVAWGAAAVDHTPEQWSRVIDLNVNGLFYVTQAVGRLSMIPSRTGRVVNVASIAGLKGSHPSATGTAAYNASKGGVISLTRALAGEWGKYGITVNALAPGWFPSRMTRGVLEAHGEELAARAPLGKLGGPDDLKGAALLFASDAGGHITGQVLAVDGGVTAI